MAVFVYITDKCRHDAQEHAHVDRIEKFSRRIEHEQRTTLFDNFPPPYLKKRFERQIRLLAAEHPFGEHVVVCFYRLLVRSSRDYAMFIKDPVSFGRDKLLPLAPDDKLSTWLAEQVREAPVAAKSKPSKEENQYLWDVCAGSGIGKDATLVYETGNWIAACGQKRTQDRLIRVHESILDLCDHAESGGVKTVEVPRTQYTVIYRYFPRFQKLLLLDVFPSEETEKRRLALRKQYARLFEAADDELADEKDVITCASRSYPAEILLDEDLWLDAEKDAVANLALSPEEVDVLTSVQSMIAGTDAMVGFPLFINGHAGSGKSTILQYLFADYLELFLSAQAGTQGNARALPAPLYLTCSNELLVRSRTVLAGLLKCNSRRLGKPPISDASMRKAMDSCFQEFHGFLYGKLTADERVSHFQPVNYVAYARFKQLWAEKFHAEPKALHDYPADLSWHVIRTYIKGINVDDYLAPEDYRELPRDGKTVSEAAYKLIYDKVWESWYRPEMVKSGLWDDQDLVRYLLDKSRLTQQYPVVFADEAQDFTRVELESLLRLSLFSERQLDPREIGRVPFAFAGDPFQTLNPTGFRWDTIKAAFVSKFVEGLDPARQSQTKDLNYRELRFNYRSTRNIVKLCNTIQALRAALLDIPSLEPQTSWAYETSSPMPVFFERGDRSVDSALKRETDITIILPCEEGEEVEFVKKDKFLSALVRTDETGVPQNALSSARAKGLEFGRVLLYGFGSHCPPNIFQPLLPAGKTWNETEALACEYFLNRLYVGASRPKRRLYVIDSQEGLQRLWRFATQEDFQKQILARLPETRENWRSSMTVLQPGMAESWCEDREDLTAIAVKYEAEGRAKADAYLLRSAAMSYENVAKEAKAKSCKAAALEIERKFDEAGEKYEEVEQYDDALRAFWVGRCYRQVCRLSKKHTSIRERLSVRLSHFLAISPVLAEGADLLGVIAKELADEGRRKELSSDPGWMPALNAVLDQIAGRVYDGAGENREHWDRVGQHVDALVALGVPLPKAQLAKIKYQVGQLSQALAYWDEMGQKDHPLYKEAHGAVLAERFGREGVDKLTDEDANELAKYFLVRNRTVDGVVCLSRSNNLAGILKACQDKQTTDEAAAHIAGVIGAILVRTSRWSDLVSFLKTARTGGMSKKFAAQVSVLCDRNMPQLWAPCLYEMARHPEIDKLSGGQYKRPIAEALKGILNAEMKWVYVIPVEIAGAVMEYTGRDIDCLQFYEVLQKSSLLDERRRTFAARRWLRCKFKQAVRQERTVDGEKRMQEVEQREKELQIEVESLPEFPVLPNVPEPMNRPEVVPSSPVAPPPDKSLLPPSEPAGPSAPPLTPSKVESPDSIATPEMSPPADAKSETSLSTPSTVLLMLRDLELEYCSEGGILNLKQGVSTLAVRAKRGQCVSVDFAVTQVNPGVFTCEELKLRIAINSTESKEELEICDETTGVRILFPIRPPQGTE